MPNINNGKNKQKKSKTALGRILSFKNILDTLHLLGKHDKVRSHPEWDDAISSSSISNNNNNKEVDPFPIHILGDQASRQGSDSFNSRMSDISCTQIPTPASIPLYSANNSQPLLETHYSGNKTWPHQNSVKLLQDKYLIPSASGAHTPRMGTRTIKQPGTLASKDSFTQTSLANCSSKNQATQTEENTSSANVNADIVKYLGQFNDKVAFSFYSPTWRKAHGLGSAVTDTESCDSSSYFDRLPYKWSPRPTEECTKFPAQDNDRYNLSYGPEYNPTPLQYAQPQWRLDSRITTDSQKCPVYENVELNAANFLHDLNSSKGDKVLAPKRIDKRRALSEGSCSLLSSESDSDFVFYPCSSMAPSMMQHVTLVDSRCSGYLSPPLDLPASINTNFSWRSDFYGSSLDEVTLQFFLDEDALSDDVFVDDHDFLSDFEDYPGLNYGPGAGYIPEALHDGRQTQHNFYPGDLTDDLFGQSYGDNCYAYRYADIDEVLNECSKMNSHGNVVQMSPFACNTMNSRGNVVQMSPFSQTGLDPNKVSTTDDYFPPFFDPAFEDVHLKLGSEFSSVLDSLRRNSTQSKARKMWKQRRAKGRKDVQVRKEVMNQPTVFTFDYFRNPGPSFIHTSKPLRSILKNKDVDNINQNWEYTQPVYCTSNKLNSNSLRRNIPNNVVEDLLCRGTSLLGNKATQNSLSSSVTFSHYIDAFETSFRRNEKQAIDDCCRPIKALRLDEGADEKIINSSKTSDSQTENKYNVSFSQGVSLENLNSETLSTPRKPSMDQFHIIVTLDSDGSRQVITVRKSSLELFEWTRTLQRRNKRLATKGRRLREEAEVSGKQVLGHNRPLLASV